MQREMQTGGDRPAIDWSDLVELYTTQHLSSVVIARRKGCCKATVLCWLRKQGIVLRSKGKPVNNLDSLKHHAVTKGGALLSAQYINKDHKYTWQCNQKHTWVASWGSVKNAGRWCPHCTGRARLTQEHMLAAINKRGGMLVKGEYRNAKSHFTVRCRNGHQWETTGDRLRAGGWCRKCFFQTQASTRSGPKRRRTLEEFQRIAQSRQGRCLSATYNGVFKKLRFRCKDGHEWETTPVAIHLGAWCPQCKQGVSQRLTRAYFEHFTGVEFPTVRPVWLRNERGRRLELDGYAPSLKVAFEYQGPQHYVEKRGLTRREGTFEKQQAHDHTKRRICRERRITLIEVPYTVTHESSGAFILEQLAAHKIPLRTLVIPSPEALRVSIPTRLDRCYRVAAARGGQCLATTYLTIRSKVRWRCKQGHEWDAEISSVVNGGKWCGRCAIERSRHRSF